MYQHIQKAVVCTLLAGSLALSLIGCESQEDKLKREQAVRAEQKHERQARIVAQLLAGQPVSEQYSKEEICEATDRFGYALQACAEIHQRNSATPTAPEKPGIQSVQQAVSSPLSLSTPLTSSSPNPGAVEVPHQAYLIAPSVITKIFTPEMIGADRAYLEQFTGVARQTRNDMITPGSIVRIYHVNGCDITAYFGGNSTEQSVNALAMDVSAPCTFDLAPFIQEEKPVPVHQLTFGDFDQLMGHGTQYYADCLGLCGNAYDPAVYSHYSASRALGFVEVMASSTRVNDTSAWENIMRAYSGDEWVQERRYNCEPQHYSEQARSLFAKDGLQRIEIGYGLKQHHWLTSDCHKPLPQQVTDMDEEALFLHTMQDLAINAVVSSSDGYANLRLGAGTQFPVIDKIHTGAQLNISHIQDKWAYVVVLDGARPAGWIHLSQITRVN